MLNQLVINSSSAVSTLGSTREHISVRVARQALAKAFSTCRRGSKDPVMLQKSDLAGIFPYIISPLAKKNNPGSQVLVSSASRLITRLVRSTLFQVNSKISPARLPVRQAKGLACFTVEHSRLDAS